MKLLKYATAVTERIGPFVDATDGVTPETGLAGNGVELSKNGGAFAARNSATATVHDAEGWYSVALDATDTGTLGRLTLKAQDATTHLPVWEHYMVLPAKVYDSLVAGSDNLEVDVVLLNNAANVDVYLADISLGVDGATSRDEYSVRWFKNGVRVTSGITDAMIQLVKWSDGADKLVATAMTEIGSTGAFKYSASGSARIGTGESCSVVVTATIDGATRTFERFVSRDSA
jgi:hypothetical protein